MARPHFFAFYPGDFAGDFNVEAMTTLQVGAYILLLCKAWQADPPASLPNDDAVLARFARLSPGDWAAAKAGVLAPFTLGTDNRWYQKRLRQEYEKARMLSRKREKAGEAGAAARWQPHGNRMANGLANGSQTDANQSQSKTQNKDKDKDPPTPRLGKGAKPDHPLFAAFWAAYPRKVDRPRATAAFAKIDPDAGLIDRMLAAIGDARRSDGWRRENGKFIPHPATWLNGCRWEDAPPEVDGLPSPKRTVFQTQDDRTLNMMFATDED